MRLEAFLLTIRSSKFERERTWSRISKAYLAGSCVLTVGTGVKLPEEALLPFPLLPAHCYAVIGMEFSPAYMFDSSPNCASDVAEEADERFVTILDTWVDDTQERNFDGLVSALTNVTIDNMKERGRKGKTSSKHDFLSAVMEIF
jgi:hypothetical protein